jgi:WD40 repeat protein
MRIIFGVLLCVVAALLALSPAAQSQPPQHRLGDLRGVWAANLNHDSSRVVVRQRGGAIGLWDANTGAPVPGDLDPAKTSDTYAMSADAKLVIIGYEDGSRVFDTTSAAAVSPVLDARLTDQLETPALFSPDGGTVLIFGPTEVSVWNVRSGEGLAKIPTPPGEYEEVPPSAIFARDGTHCFVMDRRGSVTRYDAGTWKPVGKPMRHPAAESAYEFGFAASDDGKWIATFDRPGENGPKAHLQLWDAVASKALGKPIVAVNGLTAQFISSLARVLITPSRGEAHVRELPSGKVVFKARAHDDVEGPVGAVSPDDKWVLTWGADRRIDVIDAATGKLANNYPGPAIISKLMFSPDSSTCYVAFDNTAFFTRDFHDYYLVALSLPNLEITGAFRVLEYLHRTSLSPDGRRLLLQQGKTDEERIVLYDTATMNLIEWPQP